MRLLRTLSALFLLAASAACAVRPAVRPEGAPTQVVVLASSRAPRPTARSLGGELLAVVDEPREVLAREGRAALEARGFNVLESVSLMVLEPSTEQVKTLVEERGAEAAVVLVLRRLDLATLHTLGQVRVAVEARLVGTDGGVLWSGTREFTTSSMFTLSEDWRPHLRRAVMEIVREVP